MVTKDISEADEHDNLDNYIHAELLMDIGGERLQGRVVKRAKDHEQNKKGHSHQNPIFNTCTYLVEFAGSSVGEYLANIIAENIYSQIDSKGCLYAVLKEVSGHHKVPGVALEKNENYILSTTGTKCQRGPQRGGVYKSNGKGVS